MSQWSDPITVQTPDGGTAKFVALLFAEPWRNASAKSIVVDVVLLDAITGTVTPEFIASLRQFVGKPLP